MRNKGRIKAAVLAATVACGVGISEGAGKPNVVIVMTDDQGYGDLGFTGNDIVKTPAVDKLREQGTLLDNFHVDPTCAPTRAGKRWILIPK